MLAALLVAGLLSVDGGPRAATAPPSTPLAGDVPGSAQSKPGRLVRELPELRTRTSRTFEAEDGSQVTRVFSVPVNYRAADGSMEEIDLTLKPAVAGRYAMAANSYGASLPSALGAGAVRVSHGSDWVSFALRDAVGRAQVDGNVARYADVRPGVDAVYTVGRKALREELVLADASATRSFSFSVSAAAGLRPHVSRAGEVRFEDADGTMRMALAAPFMRDAKGETRAVDSTLTDDPSGGWTLSYKLDDRWLDAADRAWPVTVDPSAYPTPDRDCWIENLPATVDTSFCSSDKILVGYGGSPTPSDHRGLLHFDIQGTIPVDSTILWARATLWFKGQTTTTQKPITLHRITSAWTGGATWNRKDGTTAWGTAGGDFQASPEVSDDQRAEPVGGPGVAVNKNYEWDITGLAREWLSGQSPNYGVMLRDDPSVAQTNNTIQFSSGENADTAHLPFIDLQYTRRVGERRGYTLQRWQLNDRMQLAVNPAAGHVMLSERDLTVAGGTGPDMQITRTYNGRGYTTFYESTSGFGDRWTANFGDGYRLRVFDWTDKDAFITGPTGEISQYERIWSGGSPTANFRTPAGYDNRLVRNLVDGTYTLTENASQYKHIFDAAGRMTREEDRNGRGIAYTWSADGAHVDSIKDSQQRVTSLTWGANGQISRIVDPAGRQYLYGYDTTYPTILRTYTDPNGGITRLDYYGEGVKKITTPGGRMTDVDYYPVGHAWAGKVKHVIRETASTTDIDPKWEFFYDTQNQDGSGVTRIRDPRGNDTTYTFDKQGRITKVRDALNRDQKTTYTTNFNVETYTEPTNTGLAPNTTLSYDSDGNGTDSEAITGPGSTEKLRTHADYGPTRTGGSINGSTWLPKFTQNEQDKASGSSTRGTAIEYNNQEGNPTLISKGASVGSVQLGYRTGSDGKPGELAFSKDGKGNQTTYNYDTHGNLTQIVPPAITGGGTLLGSTDLDYSGAAGDDLALSRITKVTDGRRNTAEYLYDNLDRVTRLTHKRSDGTEESHFEYTYDGDGNLTQRKDVLGATTRIYGFTIDELNRVTAEQIPGASSNTYSYDRASNLTSLQDAGGTVSYGYDAINRQSSIQEPGAASPITYTYNDTTGDSDPNTPDNGQKITTTLPNGVATVDILDPAARLLRTESKAGATVLQRFLYQYKLGSNEQALVSRETDMTGATTDYAYDLLDRLATVTDSGPDDFVYTYDAASNLATRTVNGGTVRTYRYNEANQLCWFVSGASTNGCGSPPTSATTFTYDADGQRTGGSGASATYNTGMQMTALGSTSFAYAGPGQAQRTIAGSTTIVNNLLGVGSHTTSGVADYFTRDERGEFVSQRRPSASAPDRRTYPLTDQLGSTRTLVNESAAVVRRYKYEPYGSEIAVAGSWTTTTPFKFAGGERDPSGLYHFGQRYFDPQIQRWTQRDPLSQTTDLVQSNRYGYAGGDPLNFSDPSGCSRAGRLRRCVQACALLYCGWDTFDECGAKYTGGVSLAWCVLNKCKDAGPCVKDCLIDFWSGAWSDFWEHPIIS